MLALTAVVANAQPQQAFDAEQHVKNLIAALENQIALTPEKKSQIENLYTAFYSDLRKMREESQGNFDRQKFMDRREKLNEGLRGVLSQEEFDKLTEVERSLRGSRRPGGNRQSN